MEHKIDRQAGWFHLKYNGEDRDDGCTNELSIYQDKDEDELQLVLSNVDFDDISHDNTIALTKDDARALVDYLQKWIE